MHLFKLPRGIFIKLWYDKRRLSAKPIRADSAEFQGEEKERVY